jgi:putative membrane protein PagO
MIKVGLEGAPPMTAVAVRYIIAAILLAVITRLIRVVLPKTRAFLYLSLFLGVFHIALPYALVYWGEQFISSGLTAVLFSTMPIHTAILARFMLGDALTVRKMLGILVGVAGVWVVFSESVSFGGGKAALGMAACLLSAFSASLATVVVKKHAANYHPYATLLLPFVVGAVLLTAVAVPVEVSNPLTYNSLTWFTIFYLAALGSVAAFGIYFWIVKKIDVTVLTYQTFIIPVLAVLIGWMFLRETITIRVGVGSGLILTGIALATLRRRGTKAVPRGG